MLDIEIRLGQAPKTAEKPVEMVVLESDVAMLLELARAASVYVASGAVVPGYLRTAVLALEGEGE